MEKSIYSQENTAVIGLLRQIREENGITQVDLAASLGVTQSYVSKIERGERMVDIVQLRTICHRIGTTLPKFVEQLETRLAKKK